MRKYNPLCQMVTGQVGFGWGAKICWFGGWGKINVMSINNKSYTI